MNNLSKGQTLIEVLIALAAASVIMFAVTTAVVNSLNNATEGRTQSVALGYAQEGIEIVRNIRNTSSWSEFQKLNTTCPTCGTYCMGGDNKIIPRQGGPTCQSFATYVPIEGGNFLREIHIHRNQLTRCELVEDPDPTNPTRVPTQIPATPPLTPFPSLTPQITNTPYPIAVYGTLIQVIVSKRCINPGNPNQQDFYCETAQLSSCFAENNWPTPTT